MFTAGDLGHSDFTRYSHAKSIFSFKYLSWRGKDLSCWPFLLCVYSSLKTNGNRKLAQGVEVLVV